MGRREERIDVLMQYQEAAGANEDMARQLMYFYSITYYAFWSQRALLAVENTGEERNVRNSRGVDGLNAVYCTLYFDYLEHYLLYPLHIGTKHINV